MGAVRSFIIEESTYPINELGSYQIDNGGGDGLTEAGVYVLEYESGDSFTDTRSGVTRNTYAASTSANQEEGGRTFAYGSTVNYSASSSGSFKTKLLNGFTSTSTNSASAAYELSTRVSNVSDYEQKSYVNRSTVGTNTYSFTGDLTLSIQTLGEFSSYAKATMHGQKEDGSYTAVTTRTNMTTVKGQSWFTTAKNSKRTTTSSSYPRLVTITDTLKYTGHYFSLGVVDSISLSRFISETTEGQHGVGYLPFEILETANQKYEQGVIAWAYEQANGDDGLPGKQGPQEEFYNLKTDQGDRWENHITTSASAERYVPEEKDASKTKTIPLTEGVGIKALTYNDGSTTATLPAQSSKVIHTVYSGVVLASYATTANAFTVATAPVLSFVKKDNDYTTFAGKVVIPLVTNATSVSVAVGLWSGEPNGSGSGSDVSEVLSMTTSFTYSASNKAEAGNVTSYGQDRYGVQIVPGSPVGGVGKLKLAAGFVGFGNTSVSLSAQKSFWKTSTFSGAEADTRFTLGDTGSLTGTYLPQFFTERMGHRQTILDLNDRCQSTRSFVVTDTKAKETITSVSTQTTGATIITKAIAYSTVGTGSATSVSSSVATGTSRLGAWKTTTTTRDSTYIGSVSYKWLPQPTSKSAMTSRAIGVTVRDEKLQEVRGTRTVVLRNEVKAEKGGWEELPTVAIGDIGMINGALYSDAILTWCHAIVDMTITKSNGETSTVQKSQGNGNKVYTLNIKGMGIIANPRPVAWAGIGGNGYVTAPFFPSDQGDSPVFIGRSEKV